MFDLFKRIKSYFRTNKKYRQESQQWNEAYSDLQVQIARLEKDSTSPSKVIEAVLGRGIEWYDYKSLSGDGRRQYFEDAQKFLRNKTIGNEINHIVSDLVQKGIITSLDSKELRDMQMTINGVELLRTRLAGIENPEKPEPSEEDLHSAV